METEQKAKAKKLPMPSPFLLELQQVYLLGAVFGFGIALAFFVDAIAGLAVAAAGFYFGYKKADEVERTWAPKLNG